jgi:hypothetical protein
LSLKECAQLSNQTIGNYNHHYIQNCANLAKPVTFFGWLAATNALQSTAASGTKGSRSGGNSRNSSPKKTRLESPGDPTVSKQKGSPNGGLGNIIVKVKKTAVASASGGTEPSTPPNSGSQPQAKRFTPNGLSPGE